MHTKVFINTVTFEFYSYFFNSKYPKISLFTYSMVTTQEKRAFIKYNSEKKESIKNKLLISMLKTNTIFTFFSVLLCKNNFSLV